MLGRLPVRVRDGVGMTWIDGRDQTTFCSGHGVLREF